MVDAAVVGIVEHEFRLNAPFGGSNKLVAEALERKLFAGRILFQRLSYCVVNVSYPDVTPSGRAPATASNTRM